MLAQLIASLTGSYLYNCALVIFSSGKFTASSLLIYFRGIDCNDSIVFIWTVCMICHDILETLVYLIILYSLAKNKNNIIKKYFFNNNSNQTLEISAWEILNEAEKKNKLALFLNIFCKM